MTKVKAPPRKIQHRDSLGRRRPLALVPKETRAVALRQTAPDNSPGARVFTYSRNPAGVYITADEALKVSAVWACLNYLHKTIGQLPWGVYRKENARRIEVATHPVHRLLRTRPNSEMTPMQFQGSMTVMAALYGYGIAEIEWDQREVPIGLWPIHSSRVQPIRAPTGELLWQISQPNGGSTFLTQEDVFHVPGFGDGPIGMSVYSYAADSLGEARAQEIFGSSYFGQGANPSGVVKTKGTLDEDGLGELKNQFRQYYQGPQNQQNVMFLDADMEFMPLTVDPEKSQMVQARQHKIEEICRWFGVPPHKIQHLLRATFSNIEHQSIEVVVDSIVPWVLKFEQEANYKLFSARQSFYTKMDVNGLLRGDFASRTAGYRTLWSMGAMSANEMRAKEDFDPIPEEEGGNLYLVPLGVGALENLYAQTQLAEEALFQQQQLLQQQSLEGNQTQQPIPTGEENVQEPPTASGQRSLTALRAVASLRPSTVVYNPGEGDKES